MKYDAFISYRHAELDMEMAKRIHTGLETYHIPKSVQKSSGKKKIKRVFRDQEELPIGSDLGDNIQGALAESEYLIVICSPRTKDSYWVNTEINTYISMHGRDHVLAVLIEGEPYESFPNQLLVDDYGNPVEPLAADVRGQSAAVRKKKLKTEIIRLLAPLLGCSYDDLRQRHKERKARRTASILTAVAAGVATCAVAFGIYNAGMVRQIQENYDEKVRTQAKYLSDVSQSLLAVGNREDAVLVALEALGEEGNYVPQAESALAEALRVYDTGSFMSLDLTLEHTGYVHGLAISDDSSYMVSYEEGDYVYFWNLKDGSLLYKLPPSYDENHIEDSIIQVGFCGNNAVIIYHSKAVCYDPSGNVVWETTFEEDAHDSYTFQYDAVAFAIGSHKIYMLDLSNGDVIDTISFSSQSLGSKLDYKNNLVAACINGDERDYVGVYDISTKETRLIETTGFSINAISLTTTGQLVVTSSDYDASNEYADVSLDFYVECYSLLDNSLVWTQNDSTLSTYGKKSAPNMRVWEHDGADGRPCQWVIEAVDNHIKVWDLESGALISTASFSNDIGQYRLATTSDLIVVGDTGGEICLIDGKDGSRFPDTYTVLMSHSIDGYEMRNGVLCAFCNLGTTVTVASYNQNEACTKILDISSGMVKTDVSPNGNYIALRDYTFDDNSIHFYDMAGNEQYYYCCSNDSNLLCYGFADDDTYYMGFANGVFAVININDQTVDEIAFCNYELEAFDGAYTTRNIRYTLFYSEIRLVVIENETGNILFSEQRDDIPDEYVKEAILSEDGTTIYMDIESEGCIAYSTESRTSVVVNASIKISSGETGNSFTNLAISPDGNILAVRDISDMIYLYEISGDGYVKIDEFMFASSYIGKMFIMNDNDHILLQGDSCYLTIYSASKQEYVYYSDQKYTEILRFYEYDETNTISVECVGELWLLDATEYDAYAHIINGSSYIPASDSVLLSDFTQLYNIPVYRAEALIAEAQRQFPNAELTPEERVQYRIE